MLKEDMYTATEIIRTEIQLSNDVSMAQLMFRLHEEGQDISHLGYGHPMRQRMFELMRDEGSPVISIQAARLLYN